MLPPVQMTRRKMLSSSAVAAAAGTLLSRTQGASFMLSTEDEKHPWIDAHSHIWTTDLKRYPLRNNQTVEVLDPRSFTDDELMAIAQPEGVGRAVLIQHHPYHGFDNSYLIDAWKKHPDRFRIVGQIDDRQAGVVQRMKDMLKSGVTGFRIGPRQDAPDWVGSEGMQLMWKTAAETRQSMCCLINPEDLAALDTMCKKYPETPVVIDHFARIGENGQIRESDVRSLCQLAAHPTIRVKISAYYALGLKKPPYHDLVPMIKRLYESYGAERLMWASDCPYQLTEPNTYAASVALIRDHIDFVTVEERRKMLRTTAESTFFFV
jgi:predicted TIM-barrel fold metal-dependent hydrolase